jgi:hypothetical protein
MLEVAISCIYWMPLPIWVTNQSAVFHDQKGEISGELGGRGKSPLPVTLAHGQAIETDTKRGVHYSGSLNTSL